MGLAQNACLLSYARLYQVQPQGWGRHDVWSCARETSMSFLAGFGKSQFTYDGSNFQAICVEVDPEQLKFRTNHFPTLQ